MYHGIVAPAGGLEIPYACPPKRFARHIRFLRAAGYDFVGLSDIHAFLAMGRPLPPRAVVLTFDDGFRSVYENAFPLLKAHHIPATVFVVSDHVGGVNGWEAADYPRRPLMNWQQLREMHAHGIEIGGHSRTHPRLDAVDEGRAREEIAGCKKAIEGHLGRAVKHFAYPHGAMSETVRRVVRESGYVTACAIVPGFNDRTADPFALCRLEARGTDSVRQLWQKLLFGKNDGRWSMPVREIKGRLKRLSTRSA